MLTKFLFNHQTAQNAESLGIDPEKGFLVAGESSGGEMAVIVAHLCLNDKLTPPLTGIYAAMPGGVNHETVPEKYKDRFISFEQNADAPILSAESLAFIWSKLPKSTSYTALQHT